MACDFSVIMNPGPTEQIEAAGEALELVHAIEGWLSIYQESSELSAVNRMAADAPVRVRRELFDLLQKACEIHVGTDGAFDMATGSLTRLWRACRRESRIPLQAEIDVALQQVGLKKNDSPKTGQEAAEKAEKSLKEAQKKLAEAGKALAEAESKLSLPLDTAYKRRSTEDYPTKSTGRRLAFARWVVSTNNPLTARVAMNQIWLRHFGQGLVPSPSDFGHNGKPPSHPQLLDWLAGEFMARGWDMKAMHKLIVTSGAYRMASTPDERNAKIDPDNIFLWRMNSRRMEAEAVRDNLLHVAGDLDPAMSGPDIDHNLGLTSKRRSIYLRQAAEKEVEFLKIFDGPAVTECYMRHPTVVPQQALAMANSEITINAAKSLAKKLAAASGDDADAFARRAFVSILARQPKEEELKLCREFLKNRTEEATANRAQESLVAVLFNHNDFVTIR